MMRTFGLFVTLTALLVFGCSKQESGTVSPSSGGNAVAESHADGDGHDHAAHNHEHTVNGWCVEHGVPEDDCTQCSKKAAEKHQKDGDWCKEHNRAESQCFICNPKKQDEFAAKYKAQFGTDLPQPHQH